MERDELIDRALASYSASEPSAGFRARVVDKIGRRQRRGWWVAIPLSAAACVVWMFQVTPPPKRPIQRLAAYVPETILKAYDPPRVVHQRHVHRVHAPVGLTEQERTLARWAEHSPKLAAGEWTAFRERADAPIEIKVLEIQPIATEEQ